VTKSSMHHRIIKRDKLIIIKIQYSWTMLVLVRRAWKYPEYYSFSKCTDGTYLTGIGSRPPLLSPIASGLQQQSDNAKRLRPNTLADYSSLTLAAAWPTQ
jgi:hypothetical protein